MSEVLREKESSLFYEYLTQSCVNIVENCSLPGAACNLRTRVVFSVHWPDILIKASIERVDNFPISLIESVQFLKTV